MAEAKKAVVIGGCPGSGKSSIINRIQRLRRATAVETGRLLREQKDKGTLLGEKLRPYLEKGELAPTELVNRVVEEAVHSAGSSLILFDGYPRNREEIQHLQEMEEKELFEQAAVIVLHLTRKTAAKRISGRRKCENCGAMYNVYFDPPQKHGTCDRCGSRLEQRNDDSPDVIEKRLDVFEADTLPAIEIFQALRPEKTINLSAENSLDTVLASAGWLLKKAGIDLQEDRLD
jgi:adenylate kinase